MKKPDQLPEAVVNSIKRYCEHHKNDESPPNVIDLLSPDNLKWDGLLGCYYFIRNNVFHGVELDGYLHT